jgi:hypothetical protein
LKERGESGNSSRRMRHLGKSELLVCRNTADSKPFSSRCSDTSKTVKQFSPLLKKSDFMGNGTLDEEETFKMKFIRKISCSNPEKREKKMQQEKEIKLRKNQRTNTKEIVCNCVIYDPQKIDVYYLLCLKIILIFLDVNHLYVFISFLTVTSLLWR